MFPEEFFVQLLCSSQMREFQALALLCRSSAALAAQPWIAEQRCRALGLPHGQYFCPSANSVVQYWNGRKHGVQCDFAADADNDEIGQDMGAGDVQEQMAGGGGGARSLFPIGGRLRAESVGAMFEAGIFRRIRYYRHGLREGADRLRMLSGAELSLTWHRGQQHGAEELRNSSGRLMMSKTWHDGLQHGPELHYNTEIDEEEDVEYDEENSAEKDTLENFNEQRRFLEQRFWVDGKLQGVEQGWFPSGALHWRCFWHDGNLHGESITWYDSGTPDFPGPIAGLAHYKAGVLHGPLQRFSDARYHNRLIRSAFFVEGKRDGEQVDYYPNGRQRFIDRWRAGQRHGLRITWYSNGQVASIGLWDNGRPQGIHTSWHREDREDEYVSFPLHAAFGTTTQGERVAQRQEFNEAGQRHGVEQVWHSNGELMRESHWRNDELHGTQLQFERNGDLQSSSLWLSGKRQGCRQDWSDGVLRSLSYYYDDRLQGRAVRYAANGTTVLFDCQYEAGERVGLALWFWESSGALRKRKYYSVRGGARHGLKHGRHLTWHENGALRSIKHWRYGELHGPVRIWHADGRLELSVRYRAGQLQGHEYRWNGNGELTARLHWHAGQLHGVTWRRETGVCYYYHGLELSVVWLARTLNGATATDPRKPKRLLIFDSL